jgi:20S proteasome alpha/beta subunit
MTCIVGFTKDGIVYMGADSCGSNGHNYDITPRRKMFTVNDRFLIGCTSSYRMIDVLEHCFSPPELTESYDPDRYMRKHFIKELRSCFKENGILGKEDDGWESGGNFLVGFDGNLFEVQPDFSVLNSPESGTAVGSGEEAAKAVLFHLHHNGNKAAKTRLTAALSAAEGTITSVKGPFIYDLIHPLGWKKPLEDS